MVEESGAAHEERDDLLADDHPHIQFYWRVVPIWSGRKSHIADLDDIETYLKEGAAA